MFKVLAIVVTSFILMGLGGGLNGLIGATLSGVGVALLLSSCVMAIIELRKRKLANKYVEELVSDAIDMALDVSNRLKTDNADFYAIRIVGLGLVLLERDLVQSNLSLSTRQDILKEITTQVSSTLHKTTHLILPSQAESMTTSTLTSLFEEFSSFIHSSIRSDKVDELVVHDFTRFLARTMCPDDEVSVRPIAGKVVREVIDIYKQNKPAINSKERLSRVLSWRNIIVMAICVGILFIIWLDVLVSGAGLAILLGLFLLFVIVQSLFDVFEPSLAVKVRQKTVRSVDSRKGRN